MDDEDHAILEMAAANAVVVPEQVRRALKLDGAGPGGELEVETRLGALVLVGLLTRWRVLPDRSACYSITQAGLDAVGSGLRVPVLDFGRLRREIGATWLWLHARNDALGVAERVLSRRDLIALGEPADADLVVVLAAGWLPLHLLFSLPSRAWLERLLRRYGNDPRVAGWLFMPEDLEPARDLIGSVAEELGLSAMSRVHGLRF